MFVYAPIFIASYVIFLALLAGNVSRHRIGKQISLGDGGDKGLEKAIRAHANALELMIPFMFLLLCYEAQKPSATWIISIGTAFGVARLFHAMGMLKRGMFRFRQLGAALSLLLTIGLAVLIIIGAL